MRCAALYYLRHATPGFAAATSSFLAVLMAPPAKKQRSVFTDSIYREPFEGYADTLTVMHEKRERLVKASRDITMYSKKVIFQVHRMDAKNKDAVLEQAEKDLASVRDEHVMRVAKELDGPEFWKYRRAYTPGVQEYVEAATFLAYCKTGELITLTELNEGLSVVKDASNKPFKINISDYLLGVGDLTGELMRLAISRVTEGETGTARDICTFVRMLYGNLVLISQGVDDSWEMKQKMDVMLQSLMKIENTCYTVHVRGSEFPGTTIGNVDQLMIDAS